MKSLGVVVIGRNEGMRLVRCLESLLAENSPNLNLHIVYVDSGSTDGSIIQAQSLGVEVVELDLSIPFTAARARNAGLEFLVCRHPQLEFVQFVDGDCRIAPGWLERGIQELEKHPEIVVVCGRRREEYPEKSIYNRLCDIEWNTPVGEAKSCGGDAMMRVTALQRVGGFNPSLIAGEEPELCVRLRENGGKIWRIDGDMTYHDAQMTKFSQWWKRSLRAGHAYAEGAWLHGNTSQRHWLKETVSIWIWGFVIPCLAMITAWWTQGWSLVLLLVAYIWLGYKVYRSTRDRRFNRTDACYYAIACTIGKFPQIQGQIQFFLSRILNRQNTLVEYKSAS